MRTFLRDNGLTIALVAMFGFSALGMILSGHAAHNDALDEHGSPESKPVAARNAETGA